MHVLLIHMAIWPTRVHTPIVHLLLLLLLSLVSRALRYGATYLLYSLPLMYNVVSR